MTYTREQATKDRQALLIRADQLDTNGEHQEPGILRVEAANCLSRVGMTKAHKVNLGPHSESNPATCLDCGLSRKDWIKEEACVPTSKHSHLH